MRKNPLLLVIVALAVLALASQCFFTVHQTQKALVLQLGEPLPEVYGPGLHFKLPFIQNVVYFDSRVLDYEARSREAFTVDKKAIVLDNYARWKIIDPLQFYRTMRSIPGAVVLGCIVVLSVSFSIVNLVVDLLYGFIDPRVRSMYQ